MVRPPAIAAITNTATNTHSNGVIYTNSLRSGAGMSTPTTSSANSCNAAPGEGLLLGIGLRSDQQRCDRGDVPVASRSASGIEQLFLGRRFGRRRRLPAGPGFQNAPNLRTIDLPRLRHRIQSSDQRVRETEGQLPHWSPYSTHQPGTRVPAHPIPLPRNTA